MAEISKIQIESGTYDIKDAYLRQKALTCFDNINDMKLSTKLTENQIVKTLGFYNKFDNGESYYIIRVKEVGEVANEITTISLSDTTLIAELLIEKLMSAKQFGAKGDGTHDDTTNLQLCFDNAKNIVIENGTYMINADTMLQPLSNTNIKLINATLKAITNNLENYAIIRLYNVTDVIIEGGTIEGDRLTHTGSTGEWGHCIIVRDSSNITLKNITLKNAWGDGLYVNNGINISTYNVICDNARRNGYSLVCVDGFNSNNDYILNTNGTNPQSAVDIEPNENTEYIKNCVFNNLKTKNNVGAGFMIYLGNADANTEKFDITVNNLYDEISTNGISLYKNRFTKGKILFNNPSLHRNLSGAIQLKQCYDSDCYVEINKPNVINCNTNGGTTPKYSSAISLYREDNDGDFALGNVTIINPYLTNSISNQRYMYVVGNSGTLINNFRLINPLNNDDRKQLTIEYTNNLIFKDEYEQFTLDTNNTMELSNYNTFSIVTNTSYNVSRTNTITGSFPIGREMTFINTNVTGYDLGVKLPSNTYCRALSSNASPTILLANTGDLITIKRISSTEFIVLKMVGNITAS